MSERATGRAEFIEWACASAHRLAGVDPDLDPDDLAPLTGMVGAARIVGLGETWHPVHEFLSMNFRVTRFLIERMGFTAVLLEGSLATSRRLDEFVNGEGPGPSALPLSSLWDNEEMMAFLCWLREHNSVLPAKRRVRILGLDLHILIMEDVRTPGAAAEAVVSYLHRADPGYRIPHLDTVRRVFAEFSVGSDRRAANFGYFATLPPLVREQLQSAFADAVRQLEQERDAYSGRSGIDEFAWALHRATVILRAVRMYEADQVSTADGLALRALAMADNVRWALEHLGTTAKAVVLATTVHLARAPWTYAGHETPIPSIGMRLADWYGTGYVALTTTFGRGAFAPPNPITGTTEIPAGGADSVDLALQEVGAEYLLVDLHGTTARHPPARWLAQPHPLRPMQNVAAPPAYHILDAFDGILHVQEIHGHQRRQARP